VQAEERRPADALYGQRVYSWVLVRAGKRDVQTAFFIDPATARHQTTHERTTGDEQAAAAGGGDQNGSAAASAEYVGVESVWNHRNYYVNMQHGSTDVQVYPTTSQLTHRRTGK